MNAQLLRMLPTLHMISPFHTCAKISFSHCAFSMKAFRFPKMMQPLGYKVIEYANGESESMAAEKVRILTETELETLMGKKELTAFHGHTAQIGSRWWAEFDRRLRMALKDRVQKGDFICHPFGRSHMMLVRDFPEQHHIETGIGYPDREFGAFRVFESYAWMHYHQGGHLNFDQGGQVIYRDNLPVVGRSGKDYEWVVPNYFDLDDWTPKTESGEYLLFFGRICGEKGMDVIREIADRIDETIIVAGQGDIGPWKGKNIEYIGPVAGKDRNNLVGDAKAMLMPTRFTEPFGGSGIEGMLCGVPLIASDFGAFTETIKNGINGYRCHTLIDWLTAIKLAPFLSRSHIAGYARRRYSLQTCAVEYDRIFKAISDFDMPEGGDPKKYGWYAGT